MKKGKFVLIYFQYKFKFMEEKVMICCGMGVVIKGGKFIKNG